MKKTLYLVTGAAGFLGSNVARILKEQNKDVRAFVLKGDPAAKYVPEGVEICYGDVTDVDSVERFFTVEDPKTELVVIHCASIVTVVDVYSKKLYQVNVDGTKNIVDKCLEHHARKLVHISSTGAIPELPRGRKIREVSHFSPEGIVGHYGKSKAMATQIVLDAVQKDGLDASIVYPSGICGPQDYAFGPVSTFLIEYVSGKMSAGVAGSFNAVDVRDLAAGVVSCIENGRKGEGYIMSNELVTMRRMFDILSEASGCKNVRTILPKGVATMISRVSGVMAKITGKKQALTSFALYNLSRNNLFSSEKAERELGYRTRPFSETMQDEIVWLSSIGKIPPVAKNDEKAVRVGRRA